jgi:hypothetical protein
VRGHPEARQLFRESVRSEIGVGSAIRFVDRGESVDSYLFHEEKWSKELAMRIREIGEVFGVDLEIYD